MAICDAHGWWFSSPCPDCEPEAALEKVTAPVTRDFAGPDLTIPNFLRRNRADNTLLEPEPWGELLPLGDYAAKPEPEAADGEYSSMHPSVRRALKHARSRYPRSLSDQELLQAEAMRPGASEFSKNVYRGYLKWLDSKKGFRLQPGEWAKIAAVEDPEP